MIPDNELSNVLNDSKMVDAQITDDVDKKN